MSDDLIERLEEHATDWDGSQMPDLEPAKGDPTAGTLRAAAARIRELESANHRLAEERDRLMSWGDRDHDEVDELRARLATAEADALEKAAAHLDRLAYGTPVGHESREKGASTYNWLRSHAEEIRSLKPKADETKKAGE